MWVHEGFTNYSETLFVDYFFGTAAGNEYLVGLRKNISNDRPIIGNYGVNKEGSGDMYDKGGNMLHSIRQLVNNDAKFRKILRGLNSHFYHQTVTTNDIESYISKEAGKDLSKVFDQYLRTTKVPTLEYKTEGNKLLYRWTNTVDGFNMPLKISFDSTSKAEKWIYPVNETWGKMKMPKGKTDLSMMVNKNFYVKQKRVS